ncbi:MAG TPA: DNA mismatch repair endonuclease MutL [Candidatus Dormibacteraeota bacterium]
MTIRALAPEVADAIAAGEVVERPASVVKELVENALDAGARRLTIEIRGAGRNLVRVVDDGAGIPGEELALAFQRHATSKVRTLADLEAIGTLGFRGEALASIAAVADVECTTSGRRIHLRAGRVIEEGPAGPAPGTVMEVRDLFANTPARLKFLKSEATETAACLHVVQQYALLHPELRFRAVVEGKTALQTPGTGLADALGAVHGGASAREMLTLDWPEVAGAVSQPKLSRGTRDGILLAVNGRPIASRALGFALDECYRGSLERGRHPVAVIDLAVDPGALDVNVHPAKREVKFREEGAVFASLQKAVRAALAGSEAPRLAVPVAAALPAAASIRQLTLHEPEAELRADPVPRATGAMLRPLGQVLDGYLVAEGPDGVVLIDQHAAHERVLFNRFRARLEGGGTQSQALLLPVVIELDPARMAALAGAEQALRSLGFEVEAFGPRAARVMAAPAETPPARIEAAFLEVLEGLRNHSIDDALASLSCHSAVRFGDPLEPAEQRRLIEELESTTPDATCPHGRPTRLVLDWQDLKRHFRRNY